MLKRLAALALGGLAFAGPVLAGPAGDLTRVHLYSGDLTGGLEGLAGSSDPEALFGAGMIGFVQAVEGFAQALYRHGLAAPDAGPMVPMLSMPIPPNPNPEPLDYARVRAILDELVTGLDAATVPLLAAGESGDYVVTLDPLKFRVDVNGDGKAEESESVGTVLATAFGMDPAAMSSATDGLRNDRSLGTTDVILVVTGIGFDRADAIWLAGYANVLAAQAEFLLAHDFSDTVNSTFHRLFPKAGLPMQEFSQGGMLMLDPQSDNAIADAIALIHTINWPVTEPERLAHVLTRLETVTALSRRNWDAILAETDDNSELVPSPKQTPMLPDGRVTEEMVAAWRATLDTADEILAGNLLVPHWRFRQGFDLKAYFETATRTDLVMLLSGYGAVPFLKDGPIASADSFAEANRVFGDQLLGYAFWFN